MEQKDFAAGTSSRSTKLVHGGVRYLEKAFWNLDYGQLKLVFEALHERKTLLRNAPHLSHPLPIMTPCYQWWEVPYYWAGMKLYDVIAWSGLLVPSSFESAAGSRHDFPTLAAENSEGDSLKGTIVYYDGQFNDSRLCVSLACTAAMYGAAVANYTQVQGILRDGEGRIVGATVKDVLGGEEFDVHAKVVVNSTGPFSDGVRRLADAASPQMIAPSAGVHITLPDYYAPDSSGLIVPKTKDGRVVFLLPWLGHTIAGTTDSASEITMDPQPSEQEIKFILDAVKDYLTVDVRRSDVLSAWSGIRPLALDPSAADTASISRDHVICEEDGLLTIAGGKWTTYRRMAEEAVDAAIATGKVAGAGPCITDRLPILGAAGYHDALFTTIAQTYVVPHRPGAIDTRVAKHLAKSYGDRAYVITKMAEDRKLGHRLARGHPELEAEIPYCIEHEYCFTVEDFLARRSRLLFKDTLAAKYALPKVVELMGNELGWSKAKRKEQTRLGERLIGEFTTGT